MTDGAELAAASLVSTDCGVGRSAMTAAQVTVGNLVTDATICQRG
jgi:hypothetical protein